MRITLALATSLSLGLAATAHAAVVTFYGADNGVGPAGPFTNAAAAAASFNAATPNSVITFEGATLPNVAPGVSLTSVGDVGTGIQSVDQHTPEPLGFNTTPLGTNWLKVEPGFNSAGAFWTFTFSTPISAFGAYFTDTQSNFPGPLTVSFNDGVPQSLGVTKNDSTGGILFFGFTDSGASITAVTISSGATSDTRDIFGIDDVRFGAAVAAVPLPAALPLFATGLAGLGLLGWRRKKRAIAAFQRSIQTPDPH
jgi:hypothetical protein